MSKPKNPSFYPTLFSKKITLPGLEETELKLYESIKTLLKVLKDKVSLSKHEMSITPSEVSCHHKECHLSPKQFNSASFLIQAILSKINESYGRSMSIDSILLNENFSFKAAYHTQTIASFTAIQKSKLPTAINRIPFDRILKKVDELMNLVFNGWENSEDSIRLCRNLDQAMDSLILAAALNKIELICKHFDPQFTFAQDQEGHRLSIEALGLEKAGKIFGYAAAEQVLDLSTSPLKRPL